MRSTPRWRSATSKAPSAETHGYIDQAYYSGNESRTRFGIGGSLVPDVLKGSVIRKMVITLLLFAGLRALLKGLGVWI